MNKILIVIIVLMIALSLYSESSKTISIFYKDKAPSLKVLAKVDSMLTQYKDIYEITYYNIEEESNQDLIKRLGLPETHFPFAVAVNGKYTAIIEEQRISFVHFPTFMHGIGRHEGNWSINNLKLVLDDNSLLLDYNSLPVLPPEEEGSKCEE